MKSMTSGLIWGFIFDLMVFPGTKSELGHLLSAITAA